MNLFFLSVLFILSDTLSSISCFSRWMTSKSCVSQRVYELIVVDNASLVDIIFYVN